MKSYPTTLEQWEGFEMSGVSEVLIEQGLIDHWLEAVRDANPLYWDESEAAPFTGGIIAPPPMMFTFCVAYRWSPRRPGEVWDMHGVEPPGTPAPVRWPNHLHYMLKEFTGLREAIVVGNESEFYEPMRVGDRLGITSRCYDISAMRTNRLGTGRSWTIANWYRNQHGQLVGIDRFRLYSYNREA